MMVLNERSGQSVGHEPDFIYGKQLKKQCFWMPKDGRTGAGMPELRGGEIKQ